MREHHPHVRGRAGVTSGALGRAPDDGRHLGSYEPSPFTRGRSRWPRPLLPHETGTRRRSEILGGMTKRRQGCQRPDRVGRRGSTTPASRSSSIRRSGSRCRETPNPPDAARRLRRHGVPEQRELRSGTGNARGTVSRRDSGGRRRSDASRALTAEESQGPTERLRALAGRTLETLLTQGTSR